MQTPEIKPLSRNNNDDDNKNSEPLKHTFPQTHIIECFKQRKQV